MILECGDQPTAVSWRGASRAHHSHLPSAVILAIKGLAGRREVLSMRGHLRTRVATVACGPAFSRFCFFLVCGSRTTHPHPHGACLFPKQPCPTVPLLTCVPLRIPGERTAQCRTSARWGLQATCTCRSRSRRRASRSCEGAGTGHARRARGGEGRKLMRAHDAHDTHVRSLVVTT